MAVEALAETVSDRRSAASAPPVRVPSELELAVARLESRRPPRLVNPASWAGVIADAKKIVADGWAAQALALGWSMTDLFGVGPRDSWEFSGLAVWLDGRDVLMLGADMAMAQKDGRRATFKRGGMGHGIQPEVAPVLLWDFGRRT